MFDAHAQKNILIVMLQIFDNLFHVTVQWIKRLKLCMVTMTTLPPAKELKIQVVSWQNEIRTLDVLKSPTWFISSFDSLVFLFGNLPVSSRWEFSFWDSFKSLTLASIIIFYKAVLLLWIFYVCFCLVFAMPLCASVYMCLVVNYWERADLIFAPLLTFTLKYELSR